MSFDRNDPVQLAELKTEITTDPNAYGYVITNTTDGLALINEKRPEITVTKSHVSAAALRGATYYQAYNTLAQDEQEWLTWMTGSNGFNEENVEVTNDLRGKLTGLGDDLNVNNPPANFTSIWAATGGHRGRMEPIMTAIFDVEGSRAESLWGFGTTISRDDWIAARDS